MFCNKKIMIKCNKMNFSNTLALKEKFLGIFSIFFKGFSSFLGLLFYSSNMLSFVFRIIKACPINELCDICWKLLPNLSLFVLFLLLVFFA